MMLSGNSSPLTTETGMSGSMKNCWNTVIESDPVPIMPSDVDAITSTCHDVMESGAVSDTLAHPLSSVRTHGSQYQVSGKYWRTTVGWDTLPPLVSCEPSSP